ncbi:MAG TPA: tetratricopeptide repeat protein [Alphaproteobacteria bacterium]|nr:tetratricopeptide repeat protein [Alphaproteobacteria bacterium]
MALEGALLFLGLVLGLGLLGRPNLFGLVLPLIALRFVWLAAHRRAGDGERRGSGPLRRGLAVVSLLLAGAILPGIPATIHNARSGGPPLPLPAHGGINLYTGNRPGGTGVYDPPAGMRGDMRGLIEDARRIASREAGRALDDAEASAFWIERAREAIAADPGGWLALLGRKILVYWSGDEVPDILDIRIYRRYCPALGWAIVGFVVISPFCLLGLWTVRRRRGRWIAWLFVAAALGSILPFFVNSRYRVPAVPVFLAVGGGAAAWLASRAVARDWRRLAAGAAALALLFVFVSTPARVRVDPSASYTFLGNSQARDGDLEAAAEAFRTALELRPGVETRINYARVLSRLGKKKDAAFLYAAAFEENPDFPNLALEYGNLLEEAGRTADARRLYLHAWESDRTRERLVACKLLSRLAWGAGDVDEAVRWLEAGLEVAPGDRGLLETLQRIERR